METEEEYQESPKIDFKREEIEHDSDSLYREVTLQFSRFGGFLDVMEAFGFGYSYGPEKDLGGDIFILAEIGRALLRDIERRFDQVYDLIKDQIGDVRIDSKGFLNAYLTPPSEQKVKAVSGAKGEGPQQKD